MAQQTGIVGLRGTVGGLVFAKNGSVRQKPASNKAAFDSKASMVRVRENASEFGTAAAAAKLLRQPFAAAVRNDGTRNLSGRLLKAFRAAIGLDAGAVRGARQVLGSNLSGLVGLEANEGARFSSVFPAQLFVDFQVKDQTGSAPWFGWVLTIGCTFGPSTLALALASAPAGATHYVPVVGAVADWGNGYNLACQSEDLGPNVVAGPYYPLGLDITPASLYAEVTAAADITGPPVWGAAYLGVRFYQEINGQYYLLCGGAAAVVAVL